MRTPASVARQAAPGGELGLELRDGLLELLLLLAVGPRPLLLELVQSLLLLREELAREHLALSTAGGSGAADRIGRARDRAARLRAPGVLADDELCELLVGRGDARRRVFSGENLRFAGGLHQGVGVSCEAHILRQDHERGGGLRRLLLLNVNRNQPERARRLLALHHGGDAAVEAAGRTPNANRSWRRRRLWRTNFHLDAPRKLRGQRREAVGRRHGGVAVNRLGLLHELRLEAPLLLCPRHPAAELHRGRTAQLAAGIAAPRAALAVLLGDELGARQHLGAGLLVPGVDVVPGFAAVAALALRRAGADNDALSRRVTAMVAVLLHLRSHIESRLEVLSVYLNSLGICFGVCVWWSIFT